MLGATTLSSIGHDRHQLLAATWRSVSHFPVERTRPYVRRRQSPERGSTSPCVAVAAIVTPATLATRLVRGLACDADVSFIILHSEKSLAEKSSLASLRSSPLLRSLVARARANTPLHRPDQISRLFVTTAPHRTAPHRAAFPARWGRGGEEGRFPMSIRDVPRDESHAEKKDLNLETVTSHTVAHLRLLKIRQVKRCPACLKIVTCTRQLLAEGGRIPTEVLERGRWR